jgi:ABC-2 type transport system permease protein
MDTHEAGVLDSRGLMPGRRLLAAYLEEMRSECLRYLRAPGFMLPILLFPGAFYLLFGVVMTYGHARVDVARFMLAGYAAFGVMGPGLFGFGVSLATEREGGLLTLKRALPEPPGAYLLGKMLMAMAAATLVMLLLTALAVGVGGVRMAPLRGVLLVLTGTFGVLPFCALGMWLGTLIRGQGAAGLLNLVYLPMAFLSGLWVPLSALPQPLRELAPLWPAFHLHALTSRALGTSADTGTRGALLHVAVLVAFTVVFLLLAVRRLRHRG